MKRITFTLLISLSCCWLAAQCPTGDITFSTQGQIDSFQINYPGCTVISGTVQISGGDITNLLGLSVLDSVKSCLRIRENSMLVGLSGLENLKYVGGCHISSLPFNSGWGIEISNNPVLASLQGLENLNTITGCLDITSNPSLSSLIGLDSLSSVGICVRGNFSQTELFSITVIDNDDLSMLEGLNSLEIVETNVRIENNLSLKSLDGLDNIHYIGGTLSILLNDSLFSLSGLGNLHNVGVLSIGENASLTSLSGIENLDSVGSIWTTGGIYIYDNASLVSLTALNTIDYTTISNLSIANCPNLSICNIPPFCAYLENGGFGNFEGNAPGCNSTAEVEAACIISINETSTGEPTVILSPNPAGDFLQVQVMDNEEWEISLFDLQGRQMFRQSVSSGKTISVKDWPCGFYVLLAISGEQVFTGKIVKQ